MAKLYTRDGWLDFDKLERLSSTLNIVIGPRNAGKTYGKMLYNHNHGIPYIFMRTTQKQIDTIFINEFSPFGALNRDVGSRYFCKMLPKSNVAAVYTDYTEKDGKEIPKGKPVNYAVSLLQVGSIRGFNLDYVPELIYDEFIKHPGEIIQNYGKSDVMYFDIIMTLNRAREMRGQRPLKQWLFGNSDNLGVPILQSLRLIRVIMSMLENGENYRKLPERDISIFLCMDSPAARKMKEISAIEKIITGTDYAAMAFENNFVNDDFSGCQPQPIGQYTPLAVIGRVMLMEHKTKDLYYVRAFDSDVINGVRVYKNTAAGRELFRNDYGFLYFHYLNDGILFSSYTEKLFMRDLLKIDS